MIARSKLFTTNRSQAVRIPKALAFSPDVKEVEISREGDVVTIRPAGGGWAEYFARGPRVSEDFMSDREQPPVEEREPF